MKYKTDPFASDELILSQTDIDSLKAGKQLTAPGLNVSLEPLKREPSKCLLCRYRFVEFHDNPCNICTNQSEYQRFNVVAYNPDTKEPK